MTDIVLKSQLQSDQLFYLPSVKAGNILDDFLPETVHMSSQPGAWRKVTLTPAGSATANQANIFYIPAHGALLSDMYGVITLGAPSGGTYASFPAALMPTNIKIDYSGEELHNYMYRQAFQHALTCWPIERTARILAAAGGATPGAVTGAFPIFAFWTSWQHESNDFPKPLPICATQTNLVITINLDSVANILASGGSGGSLSSLNLVYYEFIASSDEIEMINKAVLMNDFKLFGLDFQTLPGTSISSATATDIDLTALQGSIKEVCYPLVLNSDISTSHDYLDTNLPTVLNLQLDGVQIYYANTQNEIIMDQQIFNSSKVGVAATVGTSGCINFSRRKDTHIYDGGLNSQVFKRLTLNLTHALGAAATCFISAKMYRYYVYRNGRFIRIKE